jgi:hypothetical protein
VKTHSASLIGALVADAAALGLHWLYDVERIASVTGIGSAAFMPINQSNYAGTKGYFAHAKRRDGQLSQYGETLRLAMESTKRHGRFIQSEYQTDFYGHFGPGGDYIGYIDRPTLGTLINIANDQRMPSGVDDDQHPAISTLPAVVAQHGNDLDIINHAIKVTNVNSDATRYAHLFATTLSHVTEQTEPLEQALVTAAKSSSVLREALATKEIDSIRYGEKTSRACHLKQGMPLSWHILKHTNTFEDAIETNIKAGGDSCGRAIIIGSLAGAAYGIDAIPDEWMDAMEDSDALLALAEQFST